MELFCFHLLSSCPVCGLSRTICPAKARTKQRKCAYMLFWIISTYAGKRKYYTNVPCAFEWYNEMPYVFARQLTLVPRFLRPDSFVLWGPVGLPRIHTCPCCLLCKLATVHEGLFSIVSKEGSRPQNFAAFPGRMIVPQQLHASQTAPTHPLSLPW